MPFVLLAVGVSTTACKQQPVENQRRPTTTEISQTDSEIASKPKPRLLIECPLKITQTQGETDIEFLDETGRLVKSVHGAAGHNAVQVQMIGFCPNKNTKAQRIEIRTNLDRALDSSASSFSVIDANFNTIDLSPFFQMNENKLGFYVPENDAQKMWSNLPSSQYEFSVNLISEDFEIAKEWTFNLEIH